ncbi:MAG: hypothetical protein KF862_08705 [Chitinophagaceae bacterium]|nr:hypothetical protein [Chitinophagaceae bacterium]
MLIIKLDELNIDIFNRFDSWRVLEQSYDKEQLLLTPAFKNGDGTISKKNGEVWCISRILFSDGSTHQGASMCRGDTDEGPLLWSIWNNTKFQTLIVPPAPDFVLEEEGPIPFSKSFNKNTDQVFPIKFEVIPKFEIEPYERDILINIDGIVT